MRRIAIIGDTHCGSMLGLTPPDYERIDDVSAQREALWHFFCETLPKKIDIAIWMGDLIDGEGYHESSFLLEPNVNKQIDMAVNIVSKVGAKENLFVAGTPYHTGKNVDYEKHVADEFNAEYQAEVYVEERKSGIKIKAQHTISKTSTPTGGDIALKKSMLWDILNADEPADLLCYGHAHEYGMVGMYGKIAIKNPCLQIGSRQHNRYARKMLGGWYHIGYTIIDIPDGAQDVHDAKIKPHIMRVSQNGKYKKI